MNLKRMKNIYDILLIYKKRFAPRKNNFCLVVFFISSKLMVSRLVFYNVNIHIDSNFLFYLIHKYKSINILNIN